MAKKFSGNREAVIRSFELHEQLFPTLSEVFYASLYTIIFPPLFMKKTERAVEFYRQYLRILQTEFLELIEFCFDKDFRPGVLGKLYPSPHYFSIQRRDLSLGTIILLPTFKTGKPGSCISS